MKRYWDGQQWTPATHLFPVAPRPSVGLLGIIATLLGVVAAVIAFTAVNWLDFHLGEPGDKFSMHRLASDDSVPAFARAYCSWLGWILLALAGVTAFVACIPSGNRNALWAGAVVANLLACALTITAITVLVHADGAVGDVLAPGVWLAVAGFAAMLVGAITARISG